MARRKQPFHPDEVRQKIQTSQLLNRLQNHALSDIEDGKYADGKTAMTKDQVDAAFKLMAKVVPDLKSVEHTGNVGLVVQLPNEAKKL